MEERQGLFPGCIALGQDSESTILRFQDWDTAWKNYQNYFPYFVELARHLGKRQVQLVHGTALKPTLVISANAGCDRDRQTKRGNSMTTISNEMSILIQNPFLTGLVTRELLKIQEEVMESKLATNLVSLMIHRNLIFNEAAMNLLNSTPQQMLESKLPSLWVPPGELKPVNYDKQVPHYLQEVITLLKQQTELPAHRYWGWKSNGDSEAEWGQWVADIKLRDLGGGHYARLMVDLDWIAA